MNKKIEDLIPILEIACSEGNFNYSEYHFGLANGMILAYAIATDTDPKFLEKPTEWLEDIGDKNKKKTKYDTAMRVIEG